MGLNGYKSNGCKEEVYPKNEVYNKKEVDDKIAGIKVEVDLTDITNKVNTANTNSSNALFTANSAQTTANSAQTTADRAEGKANTNATSITTMQTKNVATPTMTNGSSANFYTVTKRNNTVNYYVEVTNLISVGKTLKLATLPSGYRPSGTVKGICYMRNSGHLFCTPVIIYTDGTMEVTNDSSVDMVHFIMQGAFDI